MRQRYFICKCSDSCNLKLKVNSCLSAEHHEVIIGIQKECSNKNDFPSVSKSGISESIKTLIEEMLDDDSDITPKQILNKIIKMTTKKEFDKKFSV